MKPQFSTKGASPEEAKAILRARVRAHNARRKANVGNSSCLCGGAGYVFKNGCAVCARCHGLEQLAMQTELRQSALLGARLKTEDVIEPPEFVEFSSCVEYSPGFVTVAGHGHYKLPLDNSPSRA